MAKKAKPESSAELRVFFALLMSSWDRLKVFKIDIAVPAASWKCEAPGGLLKAMKFVQGNVDVKAGTNAKDPANLEFQAIQWVKAVRHPFVLSIDRVEILGGEMVLVMELADRNLADRFAECRDAGHILVLQTGTGH